MPIDVSKMNMPELLKHISELPAKDRAPALKVIAGLIPTLKQILQFTYHKNVNLELPDGVPPYKQMETPENMGHNRLPKEMRKFQYFLPNNKLNAIKREKIFIEMLESLDPEEAKLVLMIKDKKITYKGITRKLVEEALPELFVGEQ
jgi:glycerophosphoryl diester phosphodiesterase